MSTALPPLSALVVDDEPAVRSLLRNLLQPFDFIHVVGEAGQVQEAVKLIHREKPQLVFLDIEMPGYSGLQLLEFFNEEEITFDIIFVTAYDDYAIQAFKLSAFDYLLKPVDEEQLSATLHRYQTLRGRVETVQRLKVLRSAYQEDAPLSKMAVSSTYGVEFLEVEDIAYLEAQSNYTKVVLRSGREIIASKSLTLFESILGAEQGFFRPHRSFLINLTQVAKLNIKDGVFIELQTGQSIPLSRIKRKEFDAWYRNFKV